MEWRAGHHLAARGLVKLLGEWEVGDSVFRDLASRIQLLVADGRLPVGTRLPSERDLAAELNRSRSTVAAAYEILRNSGHAVSRQGSGTEVRLPPAAEASVRLDFAHAVPPPIEGLRDLMRSALGQIDRAVQGPGFDMYGDVVLRTRIADRYTRTGVPTNADQVMITMGGQHAIGIVARVLVRRGDRVLVESPAYPHAHEAFKAVGAQLVRTPVGRHGWDRDHLLSTLTRSVAVTYLMPDFQNPTGVSMAPSLRDQVADASRRAGSMVVIDETTADLDIDRGWSDGPFARYADPSSSNVVTVGSLSKSMWGGLRLGWIRADSAFIERAARLRPTFDLGPPRLEQILACELMPRYEELLATRRAQLRSGRDHLKQELTRLLPQWDAPTPEGGLSFWVGLGAPVSSRLAMVCHARGMVLSAGPRFTVDGSQERFIRLPFTLPGNELTNGVETLARAWAELGQPGHAAVDDQPLVV